MGHIQVFLKNGATGDIFEDAGYSAVCHRISA